MWIFVPEVFSLVRNCMKATWLDKLPCGLECMVILNTIFPSVCCRNKFFEALFPFVQRTSAVVVFFNSLSLQLPLTFRIPIFQRLHYFDWIGGWCKWKRCVNSAKGSWSELHRQKHVLSLECTGTMDINLKGP